MIDIDKLAKEFTFLRNTIQEIAAHINRQEYSDACFRLGCLYNICNNHAVTIGAMIPSQPVEKTMPKE